MTLALPGHNSQPAHPITGFTVEWHHWIFVFFICPVLCRAWPLFLALGVHLVDFEKLLQPEVKGVLDEVSDWADSLLFECQASPFSKKRKLLLLFWAEDQLMDMIPGRLCAQFVTPAAASGSIA